MIVVFFPSRKGVLCVKHLLYFQFMWELRKSRDVSGSVGDEPPGNTASFFSQSRAHFSCQWDAYVIKQIKHKLVLNVAPKPCPIQLVHSHRQPNAPRHTFMYYGTWNHVSSWVLFSLREAFHPRTPHQLARASKRSRRDSVGVRWPAPFCPLTKVEEPVEPEWRLHAAAGETVGAIQFLARVPKVLCWHRRYTGTLYPWRWWWGWASMPRIIFVFSGDSQTLHTEKLI